MDTLQKSLNSVLSGVPEQFLERALEEKLTAQGVQVPKAFSRDLARRILAGNFEPVEAPGDHTDVDLGFSDVEVDHLVKRVKLFYKNQLPKIIDDVAQDGAKSIFKDLKARWAEEHALQVADIERFREGMESRWGKALGQLRMLVTIIREWCGSTHAYTQSLRSSKKKKALELHVRLLVRACQTTDEILCLLENGFADGAMARWRTLHEINIVAAILIRFGPSIAERYQAHQAIESKRALDKYMKCCGPLGFKPVSARDTASITKRYDAALAMYGKEFGGDYGWAAHHLKTKRVTFADLEVAAGQDPMRSFYQMGNDNIHAGVKSMFFRLGLLNDYDKLLAGRSNAGLTDPGQNAAHSLTQIAVAVCCRGALDDIVAAKLAQMLRDEIPHTFHRADRKLRKDHKAFSGQH